MLKFITFFTAFLISWPNAAFCSAGNEGPHGGDYVASEFVQRANEVLAALSVDPSNAGLISAAEQAQIAHAITKTPVNSVEAPLYDRDGNEVDALTVDDPTSPTGKAIHLQRARWERLLKDQAKIHQLVFHEYLWVIGVDDAVYRISSHLQIQDAPAGQLTGTSWTLDQSDRGVIVHVALTFGVDAHYSLVMTFSDDDNPLVSRGMRFEGHYEIDAKGILFHRGTSTCPVSAAALGFPSEQPFTGERLADTITVTRAMGGTSVVLQQAKQAANSAVVVRWGCLSAAGTFTEFDAAGSRAVPPEPLMTSDIRRATTTGNHQAIAYSYATGRHGSVWNWPRLSDAYRHAMLLCGAPDCQVVGWAVNSCVAFAAANTLAKGGAAWNTDRTAAEQAALSTCNASTGESCRTMATSCVGGGN